MGATILFWRGFRFVFVLVTALGFWACGGRLSRSEASIAGFGAVSEITDSATLSVLVVQPHNPPTPSLPIRAMRYASAPSWSTPREPSVANRNRNPLNIKLGQMTRRYVELGHARVSDIVPLDGGQFLKFASSESGFRAAIDLLTGAPYGDLELSHVFSRWSNRGFGTEILAGTSLAGETRVRDLGHEDFKRLLNAMATAEGYRSAAIDGEISNALRVQNTR